MRKIASLFICLLLLIGTTGCQLEEDYTKYQSLKYSAKVEKFVDKRYIEYMNTLDIQSYDIIEKSTINTSEKNRFVYIIISNIVKEKGQEKEKFFYGFDIVDNGNGDFKILQQGTKVGSEYLTKGL